MPNTKRKLINWKVLIDEKLVPYESATVAGLLLFLFHNSPITGDLGVLTASFGIIGMVLILPPRVGK